MSSFMNEPPEKFNIFRVYTENHSEELSFKPPIIESKKEISFAPIIIPQYRSGLEPQKDLSVCDALLNVAIVDSADETINLITDINAFIHEQNFPAAEHLLGRKLTVEEMARGSVFALGKKSIADQIDAELDREDLKEKMRLARIALRRAPKIVTPPSTPPVTPPTTPPATPPASTPPRPTRATTPPPTPSKTPRTHTPPPAPKAPTSIPSAPTTSLSHVLSTGNCNFYYKSIAGKNVYFDPMRKTDFKNDTAKNVRLQMLAAYPDLATKGNPLFEFSDKTNLSTQTTIFRFANAWIVRYNKKVLLAAAASSSSSSSSISGTGLFQRKMKEEDYVPFGRFLLNKVKLDSKRIFSLSYKGSGQKPEFIKNAALSPALYDCVQSFLKGEPMDNSDLEPHEKDWMAYVWEKAIGVKPKKSALRIADKRINKKGMLERLKICLGEIQAGNDNPLLIVELKDLIVKLDARGALSKPDINKLQQFITLSV